MQTPKKMELKESYFDTGELLLHVMEGPDSGPPLVLLHGATGSWVDWMPLLPHLTARWHVFALDLRGHGLSGRPADRAGYHISHNIRDTLIFLSEGVPSPAVLIGHSYGAVTGMLAGGEGKDCLRALVLEDPPLMLRRAYDQPNPAVVYFGWVYRLREEMQTVDEILQRLADLYPQAPRESLRPWAQNLAWVDPNFLLALTTGDFRETVTGVDFETHVQEIACPVLLMQADLANGAALLQQDLDFFVANARDVQVAHFPGSGHGIHTDQTDAFIKVVDEFTNRFS